MTLRKPIPSFPRALGICVLAVSAVLASGCSEERRASVQEAARAGFKSSEELGAGLRGSLDQAGERRSPAAASAPAPAPPAAGDAASAAPAQRFIAVSHQLAAEVPRDRLPDAWARMRDLCGTLTCELLSSSLQRETAQQTGSASLEMRVLPADVDKLLGGLAGVAEVVSHNTSSEDKTAQVVDVEAHIKNRTEFRDSLRTMLADRSVKREMPDLLEIQRTLSDTQADLDSSATQRKILAQLTSMQQVQIQFTPVRTLVQGSRSGPIGRALRHAGETVAESMGVVITVVAALLPWLLLIVPAVWIVRRLLRRRRAARATGASKMPA